MILFCSYWACILYWLFVLFGVGWVSRLVSLGLRSLIGLIGLSVGSVRLCICIFVCWWGLVFDGISYPCRLMITRYIGLLGLVVGFSFPFLF